MVTPGHPVVKPGSTKHETGSAAAAQAAAVASVQGKELAKASKQAQQQQDCSDHAAEGDKSAACLLSCSLSLCATLYGGMCCVRFCWRTIKSLQQQGKKPRSKMDEFSEVSDL